MISRGQRKCILQKERSNLHDTETFLPNPSRDMLRNIDMGREQINGEREAIVGSFEVALGLLGPNDGKLRGQRCKW